MEWTAPKVKALRAAYRLTREEFAELLEAAPKSVQNWETGAVGRISHYMQRALDTALERATPGQRQQFEAQVGPCDGGSGQEDATDRRQALKTITSLAGGLVVSTYLESVELDRHLEASDLGPETLHRLDQVVEHLGLAYLHIPPAQVLMEARTTRQYVTQLLDGRHTLTQRAQLYSVAGWLSALIGHASFDLGHDAAVVDGHCGTALHLARETGHTGLAAWVHGTQALVATYRDRPAEAVAFAQAGRAAAPDGSVTVVRLHAQEARAQARLGNQLAAERALAAAEYDLDRVQQTPTTSIFSFAYPYLPFYGGTCYSWLGQPDRAVARSREAIDLCDTDATDWPVARVMARVDLAGSLMQQGELDGASELAGECLDICTGGRRTDLMAARLSDLLHTLKPRLASPPVRELEGRYREVFAVT